MTVMLELTPEVEAGLTVQAQTRGLSLTEYLGEIALQLSRSETVLTGDAWERELDALVDDLPDSPFLPDEAMRRSNWYSERG